MEIKFRTKFPEAERNNILEFSQKFLYEKEGEEALDYLKNKRGFSQSIIEKFCFGYIPFDIRCDDGGRHELSGRITIPIFNQYGDLVAFSSRDWRKDAYMKFWHEAYNKSFYLYGLNLSKRDILREKKAILVEGEFDVAFLHGCGFTYSVGLMGTCLDLHQISILSRYCKDFYIVLDGDKAGKLAAEKIKSIEKEYELNKYYDINMIPVRLPDKNDPDDFIKNNGVQKFSELLENSRKLIMGEQ